MGDASDRLRELGEAGVRLLPARELLSVIGELFVELMPVEVDDATADDLARAALMRHALAEVTDRAVQVSAPFPIEIFWADIEVAPRM
jgi:hypothetical protein